jgi:antitoxin component YwqK of YwqJK toxin-antitoxin module
MRLINFYIFLTFVFGACKNQAPKKKNVLSEKKIENIFVPKKDLKLNPQKGQWFYKDKPFNGYAIKVYENDSLSEKTSYFNGKREGDDVKFFIDGSVKRKAFYVNNKLHGKKLNYLKNGQIVEESNYIYGVRHGIQKIWYDNGQLARQRNLNKGKEEGLQKAWLENGTIYVNYEAKNGRVFGMKRANLCYQLKNEKIEESKKI